MPPPPPPTPMAIVPGDQSVSGTDGTDGTDGHNTYTPQGEPLSPEDDAADNSEKDTQSLGSSFLSFLGSEGFTVNPTQTEGFALLDSPEKIDLKSNFKDVGNNSYKAETLMNNLENYLMKLIK